LNKPELLVSVVVSIPVSTLVAVIVTPGRYASEASWTVPLNAAFVAWPNACMEKIKIDIIANTVNIRFLLLIILGILVSPFRS
jgi:hypothetical protein